MTIDVLVDLHFTGLRHSCSSQIHIAYLWRHCMACDSVCTWFSVHQRRTTQKNSHLHSFWTSWVYPSPVESNMDHASPWMVLEGWRWLFIVDRIMAFTMATSSSLILQRLHCQSHHSQEKLELCKAHINANGIEWHSHIDMATFRHVFCSYQWCLFVTTWIL